jgi:hypothetical protein
LNNFLSTVKGQAEFLMGKELTTSPSDEPKASDNGELVRTESQETNLKAERKRKSQRKSSSQSEADPSHSPDSEKKKRSAKNSSGSSSSLGESSPKKSKRKSKAEKCDDQQPSKDDKEVKEADASESTTNVNNSNNSNTLNKSGSTKRVSPRKECITIRRMCSEAGEVLGSTWYLVHLDWWNAWKLYTSYEETEAGDVIEDDEAEEEEEEGTTKPESEGDNSSSGAGVAKMELLDVGSLHPRPDVIDNSFLVMDLITREDGSHAYLLRPMMMEGLNYPLLPEPAWKQLHEWYGGGPEIARKMVGAGKMKQPLVSPKQKQKRNG